MRSAVTPPSFRMRVTNRPADNVKPAATVVLEIEDENRQQLGSVVRHWPRLDGDPLTFELISAEGGLMVRMVRPQHQDTDGRRIWRLFEAGGSEVARVAVRSRLFGERLALQVLQAGAVLAELRARKLPGPWQLTMAAGDSVPITPSADSGRAARTRSVDLSSLAEDHRRTAFFGALIAQLVYAVPSRPTGANGPRFGNGNDWTAALDIWSG